ncbi:MAG: ImmA/IrrE family metallo-endopeptidase [bacterium]
MAFDFRNFRAPYLTTEDIRSKAELFRSTFWKSDSIPVDILAIAEFDLKLEIRPIRELRSSADIDALLLGNRKTIIVDHEYYMDERMQSRLRFSVAHEIGHIVLHKELFANLSHDSVEEYYAFVKNLPEQQYRYIEFHAYEFAGRLLVPVGPLRAKMDGALRLGASEGLPNEYLVGDAALQYVSSNICKFFEVSPSVIQRRLKGENLWPPKLPY